MSSCSEEEEPSEESLDHKQHIAVSSKTQATAAESNNTKLISNSNFDHARSSGSDDESEASEGPPSSHHDSEEKCAFKRKENTEGMEEMKTKLMRRL